MGVEINFIAVLLAGISSMVVGSIWYAKPVFGKTWSKLANVDMDRKLTSVNTIYTMGGTLLVSLLTAFVLAHFSYLASQFYAQDYSFLVTSITTAFWAWLGFTAARVFTHDAFEGRRKKLTLITVSHEFVTLIVMGIIIGLLGV